jgi:hypothetical protein
MTKTIHVSDDAHKLVKDIKGGRTMGDTVDDIFSKHVSERPTNPEKVFYRCDVCNDIEEFSAPWNIGYSPEVREVMTLIGKVIRHDKYKKTRCEGILKLYNIDMMQQAKTLKEEDILMRVVMLDKKPIVIAKIKGLNNPRVGEIIEPIPRRYNLRITSIEDTYKILEILAKYNDPGTMIPIVEQLLSVNLDAGVNKKLKDEIDLQILKIYGDNKIFPVGMFKHLCYLIPSFCYSLALTMWTDNEGNIVRAPVGNGFFKNLVRMIANRELDHESALTYYRDIKVT